jgi:ubiquinol-cytochrome c reductase cytochrome c1 subunit
MNILLPIKSLLASAALAIGLIASPMAASAAGGEVPLDRFPTAKLNDPAALQSGARMFVNYCLNCHSAQLMRYNRLQDIGLTDQQIKDNLLFTGNKVGDTMKIAMAPEDAKSWFGALPPDLSVTARARASHAGSGADWLYSYLRAYYRDNTRATGWNNSVFPNVGMPHVLWELQGARGATIEEVKKADGGFVKTMVSFDTQGNRSEKSEKITSGHPHEGSQIKLGAASGGKLSQAEFDGQIADLVAFLTYMADPSARTRVRLGVGVLMFLLLFTVFAWWLNREYWKDVK